MEKLETIEKQEGADLKPLQIKGEDWGNSDASPRRGGTKNYQKKPEEIFKKRW